MNPLLPIITAAQWLWFTGLLLPVMVVLAAFLLLAWTRRPRFRPRILRPRTFRGRRLFKRN